MALRWTLRAFVMASFTISVAVLCRAALGTEAPVEPMPARGGTYGGAEPAPTYWCAAESGAAGGTRLLS